MLIAIFHCFSILDFMAKSSKFAVKKYFYAEPLHERLKIRCGSKCFCTYL